MYDKMYKMYDIIQIIESKSIWKYLKNLKKTQN